MSRTDAYVMTVRMVNGNVHQDDKKVLELVRDTVKKGNALNGTRFYVKLQGRLGENNPNAWKYRKGGIYHRAQCIRLPDSNTADVYIYNRK